MDVNDLAEAIAFELLSYSEKLDGELENIVDRVADEVNQEIKSHITFNQRTGKYVKSFRIKKLYGDQKFNHSRIWFVATPHYRLTHLLENGHALRNGGRARAFPHIIFGEKLAQERMTELCEKAVTDAAD